MTCLGKWLLASAALHLLAAAGMAMLCASAQKPVAVIDLSQLGHSCREPEARQEGCVAAKQELAPPAPVRRQPVADQAKPQKPKHFAQPRPAAKSAQPAAQPAFAADAPGDNASTQQAGSGVSAASGTGKAGGGGLAGGGIGGQDVYRGRYLGFITELVQKAVVYPLQARRRGWQGTVTMSFVIRPDGSIADAVVRNSSGHAVLDASALAAIKNIGLLPRSTEAVEVHLPVIFRLTSAGGA